ncbi:serine carboxypeptidase S28 family protein [Tanacetum coccineum]|uniref:Serine carboxypeptidase S28 family protein n=1 Tax=Tanacetum coccineum TaxID=301880 RepID=A0ABQ4ZTA9_9ASTR
MVNPSSSDPTSGLNNQTLVFQNPFYLHPSDGPNTLVVNEKLIGAQNYRSWKRSVEIALSTKRKLGFIRGTVPRDANDASLQEQWDTCNNLVISWLMSSVSESVAKSIMFIGTAHAIWLQLETRFALSNGSYKYKLNRETYDTMQSGKSVSEYFSFGRHFDELHMTWAHLEKKWTRLWTNTKTLEDLCSQSLETASRKVPSFDGLKPRPLLNSPSLDVNLGDVIGPEPPIKPHSSDSSRMKVVDYLTTQTPPSSLVASFHLRDLYCYYRPCIDDPKKNYGFKPGLLGHSGSLGVDFSKLWMIEDDWKLESKEVSFLGRGLN